MDTILQLLATALVTDPPMQDELGWMRGFQNKVRQLGACNDCMDLIRATMVATTGAAQPMMIMALVALCIPTEANLLLVTECTFQVTHLPCPGMPPRLPGSSAGGADDRQEQGCVRQDRQGQHPVCTAR